MQIAEEENTAKKLDGILTSVLKELVAKLEITVKKIMIVQLEKFVLKKVPKHCGMEVYAIKNLSSDNWEKKRWIDSKES